MSYVISANNKVAWLNAEMNMLQSAIKKLKGAGMLEKARRAEEVIDNTHDVLRDLVQGLENLTLGLADVKADLEHFKKFGRS